ncbi:MULTISPECIES: hypothetical protein [unclassified Nocardia]|uniref:hypothetical protein n=1 Tax=unclassified Nocardia TaxID=2637762 RepID=UPI001CE45CDA|nr:MULTISPECIES: hypothetical protein [unclassified Nocardia]
MSFDQLMQHAKEIREKGAQLAAREDRENQAKNGAVYVPPPFDVFRRMFDFVDPLLEPYSRLPNPAMYDLPINDLKEAMKKVMIQSAHITKLSDDVDFVDTKLNHMTTDAGYLDGWTGHAAMAFKREFLDTFQTIAGNQFTALSILRGVLQAHRAMWEEARKNIDAIAENTIHILDNANDCWSSNRAGFTFTVLSAVGTVGSAGITIATAGATGPAAAIGAAATVGNAIKAAKDADISGASVAAIVSSLKQAVKDLDDHIKEVENDIVEHVRKLSEALHGNADKLVSARPALADMSDSDLIGDRGMGTKD